MRKTKMKVAIIALVLVVAMMLMVACTPAADASTSTAASQATTKDAETASAATAEFDGVIAKIPNTLKHDVHGNDAKWAKIYAAEEYNYDYQTIDPDQDLQQSVAAVETFISQGVDGIILHPITEDGQNDVIQEARDADIPIMTYCVGTTGKKVPALLIDEATVASEMGIDMAKQWMELYPDKPVRLGFVSWTNISFCFDNRTGPFLTGVKTVVSDLPSKEECGELVFENSKGEELFGATYWGHGGGDLEVAQQIAAAGLQAHPEVNIIYGDNMQNGLGVLAAYEAAGRGKAEDGVPLTEIIASTDASSAELIKLADPTTSLKYALGMQPQSFAYAEIDMMMQLINGELDPDTYVENYTPDCYFNYYKDSIQVLQDWFNTQYMPETPLDLAAEIAK
jgi:ABC-type sugar transport system substrate-binding protein